jgi:hypothetical protein
MSKELLNFMSWVNQDKKLGYTSIGIERIVNRYITSKDLIIDEAYKNYRSKSKDLDLPENLYNNLIDDLNKNAMFPIDNPSRMLSKEDFINKCKTDPEFSEKWGLKIEEKELSLDERTSIFENSEYSKHDNLIKFKDIGELDKVIPTKKITLEYNNEKTYCYE